jgi:hypothetical protein
MQWIMEGSEFVLRQSFFDRQYDSFRQDELGWGRRQPHDQIRNSLRREHSGRRSLVRSTPLAFLGREGSPVGSHRSRVKHDRPYAVLLPFVSEGLVKPVRPNLEAQ